MIDRRILQWLCIKWFELMRILVELLYTQCGFDLDVIYLQLKVRFVIVSVLVVVMRLAKEELLVKDIKVINLDLVHLQDFTLRVVKLH